MDVKPWILPLAATCLLASNCTPHQQRGAALGAIGGAAVGALAGDDSDDVLRGAAIGAAVGTGVAAAQEQSATRPPAYGPGPAQPPAGQGNPPPPVANDYPTARRTSVPDRVISPYPPYNVIDVAGFRSGQLARDPSNQKIFRVP